MDIGWVHQCGFCASPSTHLKARLKKTMPYNLEDSFCMLRNRFNNNDYIYYALQPKQSHRYKVDIIILFYFILCKIELWKQQNKWINEEWKEFYINLKTRLVLNRVSKSISFSCSGDSWKGSRRTIRHYHVVSPRQYFTSFLSRPWGLSVKHQREKTQKIDLKDL